LFSHKVKTDWLDSIGKVDTRSPNARQRKT